MTHVLQPERKSLSESSEQLVFTDHTYFQWFKSKGNIWLWSLIFRVKKCRTEKQIVVSRMVWCFNNLSRINHQRQKMMTSTKVVKCQSPQLITIPKRSDNTIKQTRHVKLDWQKNFHCLILITTFAQVVEMSVTITNTVFFRTYQAGMIRLQEEYRLCRLFVKCWGKANLKWNSVLNPFVY